MTLPPHPHGGTPVPGVFTLLRTHDAPGGPVHTPLHVLHCPEAHATRVAQVLNEQAGHVRYHVQPLTALSEEDLTEHALYVTTIRFTLTPGAVRYSVSQTRTPSIQAFHPPLDTPTAHGGGFAPHLTVWTRDAALGLHLARHVQTVHLRGVHPALAAMVRDWAAADVTGRMGAWPHARPLGGHVVWVHPTGTLFVVNAAGLSVPAAFLQEHADALVGPDVVLPLADLSAHSRPMTRTGVAS
ncbi:hypothetical protein [Deinococcus sedimenti]|uniref:DUF3298 domain-containing protein n=1 Tax=Deinococcus sedimenti TaxID=1867090 RepID=A0ABQ2S8U4_9DEIO|nr:hypothetical protein [Deinococcus sedimenti]GGS08886.1 hypothetical protein GCM10008960_38970 [Deinococcus sedimenti]